MVDSPQSGQDQLVLNQVPSKSIEQLPNGPCTHIEEEVATRSQRSSSDSSTSSKKSKLKKVSARKPTGDLSGSNWRRLRNTLKAASEMQTKKKSGLERQDSFLRKFSTRNQRVDDGSEDEDRKPSNWRLAKSSRNFVIQHDGKFMFYWLGVMTVAVLYNLWTCIAREAFREIQSGCNACWYTMDAFVDLLYILDVVVQFRTGYLDQGLMVYDSKKLAKKYISSRNIYFDTLCLVPSDLLQFYIGIHPMIRFPRFLKVYRTFRFIHMLESKSPYPNLIRVANLSHMLFLGAHWFAAFYYLISEAEGFIGGWSYPKPEGEYASVTRKYLASLFWSTLTLTTIGDLPPPDSNWEYVFVIVSYLIGVFIFATIVGQVGNVINNRNASRQEFERLLDGAKLYMQTHNVPPDLQKRVQRWYDYVWSRGRLNGCDINSLGLLPDKLKTELAIHVNLETLKKVTIFQECQPEFLHDLVLKMRAYIFTPGDLICRRGEVAREMFIVADGVVEVISEAGTVLKRMAAGDFFGEIGILNLDGGINRRTADVRSVGYSELFVLSREDVLGALKDHPDAESIIRDYGQRRLREIEAHRQRVKPLQREDGAVKNAFLMTLRNMSPKLRRHDNSNSPSSPRFSKTPSVKNTNFSFNSEDAAAFESEVKYSQHNGIFETVCGNLRRLFHRKVRRQKGEESLHLDNKGALVSAEEQAKSSVTPEPTAENEPLVTSGKESLIAQVLKLKKKPGYMAVRTDDQESCDSDIEGTKDDSKDNQIIDLTQAGKMKQLKVKEDEEKQLRTREYTPPSCKLPSSRECTPSPTSKQSSSREFSPTPLPSSSSKQSSLREFTPPPLPTSSSSGSSRTRQFTPPPVDNVKKFDIPRCKSTSASDFGRDDKRLALRLSSPPRDYVAHISTPPLASSNPTYSILTPPPAKSSHSYTHDSDVTSGSPRKCSIFLDDDGTDLLTEADKRRNCFKRHSVDMSDTRLNPILHRNNSNLSVTSQYQITNELQRLCQQLEDFTKVVDKKMSTLEEAVTGSMSRMDKMTSVQENLVTTLQDNFKLLQQSKTGEDRWEHTTPL